jgi:MFS family permease
MKLPVWLNKNILGVGLASFFSDCNHELVTVLLPVLMVHLTGTAMAPQKLGIVSGVSTAAASFTTLFSGWLSDRARLRKPFLLIGYALTLLLATAGWVNSWLGLLIVLSIAWIGRGLISAPRNALIADSVSPSWYGHVFGFRQALDSLGALVGPALYYACSSWPAQRVAQIALVPGILSLLATWYLIQEVPPIKKAFSSGHTLPRAFFKLLIPLSIFGLGNFNRTLLLLRVQKTSLLTTTILLYIFRNAVQMLASYSMGAVSDRLGRVVLLALGGFGCFALMALLLMIHTESSLALVLIFLLSGVSAGTVTSLEKSATADLLSEELRGTAYGVLQTTTGITDLLSSVVVGFIWTHHSAELAFLYAAIMSLAATLFMIGLRSSISRG